MNRPSVEQLKGIAKEIRKDVVTMLSEAGSGHTSGSLSCVDIIVTLYYYKLQNDPKNPKWADRDRFILSKGHTCPALYAVLARRGFFPCEELMTLRKRGSILQGHASLCTPGCEASTGSLGQGLSIANGVALAGRLDFKDYRVYCLMGDGEQDEGQVWEAAMTAAHYKIDNLCAIIDYNKQQIDGWLSDVKNIEPLREKWSAFGWNVIEADGHDFKQLMDALDKAEMIKGKPTVIIAHTVKGKGVSFIEKNSVGFHGTAPKKADLEKAIKEIEEGI
ncbi:MAG TPA: transketolase [Candidatus Omnitrophota bacterium]|nr:transketolase [Candidatus Omnitrophota bacterium]HOX10123.1 transketolase [Candidatus Omnitrophota bacterium]HPN66605.1 transketolase [Candidatus Omnitrophota bacterium]HRZ67033.1 transketolase [Candidatus Omnitrophota bacterium]